MSFTVIIPARYASTRLPGKPLLDIGGKPMIQHVYERACQSSAEQVVIATDDERIQSVAESFGALVCMTRADHESGTDRLQEVVSTMQLEDAQLVVNVQGDEPLIPPAVINQVAAFLAAVPDAGIATLVERITERSVVFDPNAVKVVFNQRHIAQYFSRAPIPWARDTFNTKSDSLPDSTNYYRHIGIYAYRVAQLNQFVRWSPSALEMTEKLEQLRALDNGVLIAVAEACETIPAGIDTAEDLQKVRTLLGA